MIVLINILCVSVLLRFGDGGSGDWRRLLTGLAGNPLIIACALGGLLALSGTGLNPFAERALDLVARAALPVGLLAVGAALRVDALRSHVESVAAASVVQFAIKPLAVVALIAYADVPDIMASVLVIAFVTPTAPSATILARQLGGDVERMASIVTAQTILAIVMMPILLALLL